MDSSSSSPTWAGLRSDLLFQIANRLVTRSDQVRFRAVCYSWRSSFPHPPKIPSPHPSLKLPFPIFPNLPFNRNRRGHFVLTESTIFSVQPLPTISNPTDTWLVKVEELEFGEVVLKDTLSLYRALCFKDGLPPVLDLLDYRVSEVGNAHGLQFLEEGKPTFTLAFTKSDIAMSIFTKKVVVSSSFFKIRDGGFAVMVLDMNGSVAVWKMRDEKWTNINDARESSYYVDIIFHNGKFYALDITGLVATVDPNNFEIKEIVHGDPSFGWGGVRFMNLVASYDDLFRVDKYEFPIGNTRSVHSCDLDVTYPIKFLIYKMNEENHEWVNVEGLEDRVVFLGADSSFSVMANDFPGCKRNCVYFVDRYFYEDYDERPPYGIFVFKSHAAMRLSKFPSYSKIFYPSPTWLKTDPTLSQS